MTFSCANLKPIERMTESTLNPIQYLSEISDTTPLPVYNLHPDQDYPEDEDPAPPQPAVVQPAPALGQDAGQQNQPAQPPTQAPSRPCCIICLEDIREFATIEPTVTPTAATVVPYKCSMMWQMGMSQSAQSVGWSSLMSDLFISTFSISIL